jgi:hypothetical protein
MNANDFKKRYGYDLVINDDKTCTILNTPLFPQSSNKSKKLYRHLERACLLDNNAKFPNKVKFSNIEIEGDFDSMYSDFHFDGIYQLLKAEKLNPLVLTFIKPEIYYPSRRNKLPNLIINIYQFDDNGFFEIEDEFEFIEFTFIYYNTKQFTNKRIGLMKEMGLKIEEIIQIPAIPLISIEFDDNGIIKPIGYLERAKGKKLDEIIRSKRYR